MKTLEVLPDPDEKKTWLMIANHLLLLLCLIVCLILKLLVTTKVQASVIGRLQYEIWPLGLYLLLASIGGYIRFRPLKLLFGGAALAGLLLYLIDIGAQYLLYNRVIWRLLFEFGKETDTFIGYLIYYFQLLPGILSLLAFGSVIFFFAINWKKRLFRKIGDYPLLFCGVVFIIGLIFNQGKWFEVEKPRDVFNVFQINSSTDRVSYKQFTLPPDWQPVFKEYGNSQIPKNVILVFVESLSAAYSQLTSSVRDLTPNIDELGRNGIYYTNYMSNGYSSTESRFSVLSGYPYINGQLYFDEEKFYRHSFIKFLKKQGVYTIHFAPAPDLSGTDQVYKNTQFARRVTYDDPAYQGLKRYVFDSIDDENLLKNMVRVLYDGTVKEPYFAMAVTATTHSPYEVPGSNEYSLEGCVAFSDKAIGTLVENLKARDFFENGILIVTGDHHSMDGLTPKEEELYGWSSKQRVPLIIYGAGITPEKRDYYMDHASLGALISQLSTGRYERNQFQQDPLEPRSDLLLLAQPNASLDIIDAYEADFTRQCIKLNGDKTTFMDNVEYNKKYFNYLQYLAWLRQNWD